MQTFIFVSPHFPVHYWHFVKALHNAGFITLGIGDCPYNELPYELKSNLDEYYYCNNMENFDQECEAVKYFSNKYGQIDFLDSLNEYWLEKDAKLREIFNIKNGVRPSELVYWQKKSLMKEKYKLAGLKVAKYQIVESKEKLLSFINEVGYPVFIKPNIGVGAAGDYKINNLNDLEHFLTDRDLRVEYICEQFLTGNIISFDGIADSNSNVIFASSNYFPPSIANIVKEHKDLFYYTLPEVPKDLLEIGQKTIKAFQVNNRYFHLEFFVLTEDIIGFANKGEIIPLETNMRPAGGFTTDMINFANSIDTYKLYAETLFKNSSDEQPKDRKFFCACASRRDGNRYLHTDEEIINKYKDKICMNGRYADVLSGAMGNRYFIAKFTSYDEVNEFKTFVGDKYE